MRGNCTVPDCGKPEHAGGYCPMHYQRLRKYGSLDAPSRKRGDILSRLSTKFLVGDGCWEWIAGINPGGYGMFHVDDRDQLAHRVVYELLKGPIPDGMTLDHLCRVRHCVQPDHLEPVDTRTNILRGEGACAVNARKTHCKWGHEFTEDNIIWLRDGKHRRCRTCKKEAYHRARQQ